jgi:hypothetical protein
MHRTLLLLLVIGFAAACGGSSNAGDDAPVDPDAAVTADAIPEGWASLLEGDWTLQPGEEAYFCVYATVPRDIYVKAFRPLIPPGTHHTVLTRYTGASPADGTVRCGVGSNGQSMIYGSGVGTPDFVFPTGVGLELKAGSRLLLNLHLYNATDAVMTGRSGALFQEATAAEIQHLAELVLAGPTATLRVPTGITTQSGTCQISNVTSVPIQVFAMSQHMHKLGTNMRSVITRGGTEIVLQDIAYDFEHQYFQYTSPTVELRPGDVLTTYCTYNNTTGAQVTFGESSDDEMCFTDLFYYPAQGANFICSGF